MTDCSPSASDLLSDTASKTLITMAEAVMNAGHKLMEVSKCVDELSVSEKSLGDFVSEADRQAEDELAAALEQEFPTYGWIGEETGTREGGSAGMKWIADPLDGTTNFLSGLPHWAVSVALYKNNQALAAAIFDPSKGEMFSAELGRGAFLNGKPIRVNTSAPSSSTLLATGVPAGGRTTYLRQSLNDLERLMPQTAGVRRWGAAALDLAYVACGRVDAYWERNLGPWDIAAGTLIVEEAGGEVMPLWPDTQVLETGSFIAGHRRMVDWVSSQLDRSR
ncbi:MAG: inositol monophosphatase family protein [Pseudomonadota bacterium]